MATRRRRPSWWKHVALLGAAIALPLVALTTCMGGPGYYSAKYAAVQLSDGADRGWPRTVPIGIEPERQTEPHTCGLHAMSSLYRAYGLDPEARRLRFRLGTDMPLNKLAPDSRGTIHPDLLRVLEQDGFETELLFVKSADSRERVRDHLEEGQYALTLIHADGGELHWVVLCGLRDAAEAAADGITEAVAVCDSLSDDLYTRPLATYLRETVSNVILISPR